MTGPLWMTLPAAWRTGQVKNVATVSLGKMLQSRDSGSDVLAPYMRAANVQPDGELALDDVKQMWFATAEREHLRIRAGDVVVVEGGQGGFGRAAYVREDIIGWGFQNSINRLRPIDDADGRFLAYYLIALRSSGFIRAYSNVVSMPHLSAEKLERIPIPLPPPEEQRTIADFLDRETARIDMLIEEQQRLIGMLHERRLGVVRAGVTGLLTGDRRLSFDAWFGALPETWTSTRIRYDFSVILGKMINASKVPSEVAVEAPYLAAGSIQPEELVLDESKRMVFTEGELKALDLRRGDVVVVEGGAGYGRSQYLRQDLPGWGFQNHFARLRASTGRVDGLFVSYCLKACLASGYIEANNRTATLPSLSRDVLGSIQVPNPPIEEQQRIVQYLDEQTSKIDELIAETERFIELSRERRTALITAAVTGQIDVREAA